MGQAQRVRGRTSPSVPAPVFLPGVGLTVARYRVPDLLLTIAVTATARVCLVRDRLMRRIPWDGRAETAGPGISRHAVPSGKHMLDAVLVRPAGDALASVLICHGIGETVEHWHRVQRMLAEHGVASLVFDYAGYGRSRGFFSAKQAEEDAVAAFHFLESMTAPLPVSILGLSLGSGIAVATVGKARPHRLVLCAAFTSLHEASGRVGVPRAFRFAVPAIWEAAAALRACPVPVLIVHGEKDRLFPVRMAQELAGFCGANCELVIVPGASHNDPFYHPQKSYWGETVARFLLPNGAGIRGGEAVLRASGNNARA
jgi:pimeloyl-ACP methyl ester carboxylesterase